MLRQLLLGAALCSGIVSATTGTFVTQQTSSTCVYKFGTGGVPPTPVPTSDVTFSSRRTSTSTTLTVAPTVFVTTHVTTTLYTSTAYTFTVPTITIPTSTSYTQIWKTVATGVFADTVCANGAKPTTVTKYTGTYTPLPGQETTVPATYPTYAVCSTGTIYCDILLPTVTSGATVTATATQTSYVTSYTTTSTSTIIYGSDTTYLTTVSATLTTYTPHAVTTTSTVACPSETVTKTLDARCAPTNLVGAVYGEGIRSGRYADRVSVIYTREEPWASDYTACCQACVDNEGCGAADSGFGACGLYYSATLEGEPICDAFILSFTSSPNAFPGQSLVYSTGCDTISYDGSLP
ncbi:hypothetical protein F4777DRAFT_525795 [Nemania sp. FL0916]|nr:hypothetical protein F4777DRAFT_525795 [Nemania sp. FL0916]